MDILVVLNSLQVKFAGSPNDLVRAATVSRVEVHSESHPAVRALARPFEVTISGTEGVLVLEAAEGQQLAAKMLLEGYGDVKFIVLNQPSVETALLALLQAPAARKTLEEPLSSKYVREVIDPSSTRT